MYQIFQSATRSEMRTRIKQSNGARASKQRDREGEAKPKIQVEKTDQDGNDGKQSLSVLKLGLFCT